ncbi:NUC188 domain-containing protein [Spinellus fusiger]|nr:NUC188 domain-containing protein [Spinellus fusiger]
MKHNTTNKRPSENPLSSPPQKKKTNDQDHEATQIGENILSKHGLRVAGSIDTKQFMMARYPELNTMQSLLKQTSFSTKLDAFPQQLRSQRRRPASHRLKGLSALQRARAAKKMGCPFLKEKIVLKNGNQLKPTVFTKEYLRRKSSKRWLETHLWHVKRMRMTHVWGYQLATKPLIKSAKTQYRALTHSAVLHDASYKGCIQIKGGFKDIVHVMNTMTHPFLPSVGSDRYTKGQRMGTTHLYEPMAYPTHLICPITYVWKPPMPSNEETVLWLWAHPSADKEAVYFIKKAIEKESLVLEKVDVSDICVQKQTDTLARFEITGPHATALLQSVLLPVEARKEPNVNASDSLESYQVWKDIGCLNSSCSLSSGVVLGLTVEDPRLKFPQRKRPSTKEISPEVSQRLSNLLRHWPDHVMTSDLWDSTARLTSSESRVREYALNKRREQNLLPGSKLELTDQDSKIPVLLIHQGWDLSTASTQPTPYVHQHQHQHQVERWIVLLPYGWGSAFWNSLVFAGAKVIGIHDVHALSLESGHSCFPYDYPGTRAYEAHREEAKTSAQRQWLKTPPAKRVNYKAMGSEHPFEAAFETLIKTDSSRKKESLWNKNRPSPPYCLLQGTELVATLTKHVTTGTLTKALETLVADMFSRRHLRLHPRVDLSLFLVRVRVVCTQQGAPMPYATVYRVKDSGVEMATMVDKRAFGTAPSSLESIGYLTQGAFSFMHGRGVGIGACTALGIRALWEMMRQRKEKKLCVLLRNPNSVDYYPAELQLLS